MNSGEGELYDLIEDPHEMENLWNDPGHSAARRMMEEALKGRPGGMREKFDEPAGIY